MPDNEQWRPYLDVNPTDPRVERVLDPVPPGRTDEYVVRVPGGEFVLYPDLPTPVEDVEPIPNYDHDDDAGFEEDIFGDGEDEEYVPDREARTNAAHTAQWLNERIKAQPRQMMRDDTLARLALGHVMGHATDIIHLLDIERKDIASKTFGIELEFHTSQASLDYEIAYGKYENDNIVFRTARLREIPCDRLADHYCLLDIWKEQEAYERAITETPNTKVKRKLFDECPACFNLNGNTDKTRHYVVRGDKSYVALLEIIQKINDHPDRPKKPPKPAEGDAKALFVSSLCAVMKPGTWIAKRDGSLNDKYGVEIVSIPLELKDAREWLTTLGHCSRELGACVPTHSYGMHVHINRRAFTGRAHIIRFFHTLNARASDQALIAFIGPSRYLANTQGDMTPNAPRRGDPWAKPYRSGFRKALESMEGEHHDAVSLSPLYTVEVRVFQSSVDYDVTCANLEFVAALVEYTMPGGELGTIMKFRFNKFFQWVMQKQYKTYSFLYERLLVLIEHGVLIDPREPVHKQQALRKKLEKARQQCAS